MRYRADIAGNLYGKLTALRPSKYKPKSCGKHLNWLCKCSCGTYKIINSNDLRMGKIKSCGCSHYPPLLSLVGQSFGKLVVQRQSKYKPRNWLCRCACGRYTIVPRAALVHGNTKSCGCYREERKKTHGLTGTKEYKIFKTRKRRERKAALDFAWSIDMERALRELQPACVVCSSANNLAVDHVLPLSKGYGLTPGNAVILCRSCNSFKNTRDLGHLPQEMSSKISAAARDFKLYWERKEYAGAPARYSFQGCDGAAEVN